MARFAVADSAAFEPHGLLAAFAFDRVDHKPLAAAAFAYLRANTPLGEALAKTEDGQADDAARGLVLRRTEKALSHPLLLAALAHGTNRSPAWERLFTAMRRVLLIEAAPERFEDKALTAFVLALIQQCVMNEHVFAVDDAETQRLAEAPVDFGALMAGDTEQTRRLIVHLLYTAPQDLIGKKLSIAECRAIRPRALGERLAAWSLDNERQTILAADVLALGAIEDATSRKVASQYEEHPYPRWTSLHLPGEASARTGLARYFEADKLGFLDKPFKVLIAGAGTGQHAIAAAVRYGANADVLAIDLSRRSLAYAEAKADHYQVTNLRFAQADIQAMPASEGPFDVIEAVGVLHHMAEPFKGWQSLTKLLRPGGLMVTGLYSATARHGIAELRREAGYPGPGCDQDTARRFRATLLDRGDAVAADLRDSYDFYTMSEFRDLALHEHERPIFLSEIEAFLGQNGLAFRGFQLPPPVWEAFFKTFPDESWPGTLGRWSEFEERFPRTFDAMYRLWCEKTE